MDAGSAELQFPFREGQKVRKAPQAREHRVYFMVPAVLTVKSISRHKGAWHVKFFERKGTFAADAFETV